jgi:hypothetical protein
LKSVLIKLLCLSLQIAAVHAALPWVAYAAGWVSDTALVAVHILGAAHIAKCNEAFAIRAELRIIGTSFAWLQARPAHTPQSDWHANSNRGTAGAAQPQHGNPINPP